MNNFKKGLAIMLGVTMTMSASNTLNANALATYPTSGIPLTAPDGYIEQMVSREYGIVAYQDSSDMLSMKRYSNFTYNWVSITLSEGYDIETVYEKYAADLGFDVFDGQDTELCLYDNFVSGDDPRTHESVEEKYAAVKAMCAEMYADGVIENADYTAMQASCQDAWFTKQINCADFSGTEEELKEIVDKYTEYGKVYKMDGVFTIGVDEPEPTDYPDEEIDLLSYEELAEMRDEVDALYEGDNISLIQAMNTMVSNSVTSGSTNLLTAIQEEASCDTDNSGEIEITDATAILESYANTAAGVAAASEENPMDVNGDGTVGIDDATFVLTVYAELAAGLR